MADFKIAIKRTLVWEGGDAFTNDPDDPGGGTKYGITEKTARQFNYLGDMRDLPYDKALAIYERNYWEPLSLDLIASQKIADQILQGAVNQGVNRWAKFMQVAANLALISDYKIIEDGVVGDDTICAVNIALLREGEAKYSAVIFGLQENRYADIIIKNPVLEKFRNGWHNRAVDFLVA
jgi:lysozyme family protein